MAIDDAMPKRQFCLECGGKKWFVGDVMQCVACGYTKPRAMASDDAVRALARLVELRDELDRYAALNQRRYNPVAPRLTDNERAELAEIQQRSDCGARTRDERDAWAMARRALAAAPAAPPAEQLDEVRRKVIEECARVCENIGGGWPDPADYAAAVRDLAGKWEENLPTEGKGE